MRGGYCPDFIVVDGAEGGTGAAPVEFMDSVGMPLIDGFLLVHNALVGAAYDKIKVGVSGKSFQDLMYSCWLWCGLVQFGTGFYVRRWLYSIPFLPHQHLSNRVATHPLPSASFRRAE